MFRFIIPLLMAAAVPAAAGAAAPAGPSEDAWHSVGAVL